MKIFCIIIPILICWSQVKDPKYSEHQNSVKTSYFKNTFLKKFKILDLPCVIGEGKNIDSMKLIKTDPKSMDSLIILSDEMICYGLLSDTSRFFALIYYAPAVTYIPVLKTYDKYGNEISSKGIDFGCWDGGPFSYKCDGHIKVNNKMIIDIDHVTTCFDCDSTSKESIIYSETRKGKILENGVIELEDRNE